MLAEESCLEAGDLFLARMYDVCCAAMLGLANSWHESYCAADAHAAADILGTAGNFMKLLDRYCSKLRLFVPVGLHIQMICPLLATRTDYCSSVDRSLNVPEIFKAALWNGQWLEADLAEACAWVRGSKLAPWWKFVFPTGLPPIWSHDIFADLIAALRSSMYPGEIRRILRTGVEILPGRKKILLNVLGG